MFPTPSYSTKGDKSYPQMKIRLIRPFTLILKEFVGMRTSYVGKKYPICICAIEPYNGRIYSRQHNGTHSDYSPQPIELGAGLNRALKCK